MQIKIVVISDTHGLHDGINIPDGDILIHAGDVTGTGRIIDIKVFNDFLGSLPHEHKIVIAGNHDFCLENDKEDSLKHLTNCIYLEDSGVDIKGIKFWGSPWQPWFYNWAFQKQRGADMKEKWDLIPEDTDILITHGPPHKILDKNSGGIFAGCEELYKAVKRIRPQLHIFGHIHEGYGIRSEEGIDYINASICTVDYKPVNPPIQYIYEKK